jgi:hypothetical protein
VSSRTVTVPAGFEIAYHDPTHTYKIDGEPVPSVSTVLNALDKPALVWWGMKVGAAGVESLFDRGKLRVFKKALQVLWEPAPADVERCAKALAKEMFEKPNSWRRLDDDQRALATAKAMKKMPPRWVPATMESMVDALTRNKLTTNHIRDERGRYGTGAHEMFEAWAQMGVMPDPTQIDDDDERGRVEALLAFCEDANESYGKKTEVIVGSKELRVAGRYDFECNLVGELVTKLSPRETKVFTGEPCLLDVKTAKSVYQTHFLQLEGYEGLRVESGYDPTKWRIVIHLLPSGSYRLHRSTRTFAEFAAIRPAHDVVNKPGTRW